MRRPLKILFLILFTGLSFKLSAQGNRVSTYETIGWYNYFGTFKLNDKFGLHTEFQWRRANLITEAQQNLLRLGLNYNLRPKVMFRVGYAFIETFAYGEIPINAFGKNFSEHRIYQMAQLSHQEGKLEISHRFMLEQRFVGRYSNASLTSEDEFPLLHRARYMVRFQAPLKGEKITDKTPYWAIYNEVFVGFGKNVNANVFDQNRIGVLLGYRFSPKFRLEGGYLSQIVQFGRQINGKNIFQYNNGIIINANFNFDLSKK